MRALLPHAQGTFSSFPNPGLTLGCLSEEQKRLSVLHNIVRGALMFKRALNFTKRHPGIFPDQLHKQAKTFPLYLHAEVLDAPSSIETKLDAPSNKEQGTETKAFNTTSNKVLVPTKVQAKVLDATSNDPRTPSDFLIMMHEIAEMTYDPSDFIEVVGVLDSRLKDEPISRWHVSKVKLACSALSLAHLWLHSLAVIEYVLDRGSETFITYYRDNVNTIKALKRFHWQYFDSYGDNVGLTVRQKATAIVALILDEPRLRNRRLFDPPSVPA
ncbi:hypothetical protein DXG01_012731 [Tephrocybe rancida]|nr:hypothetical protein DXG01_012731 [Tephrocybe rancida]